MSKPLFDAVLFDFDGTVVDSSEGIYNSVRYALKALGYPRPDEQALRYFIGPPLQHSFIHLLGVDEARAQALVENTVSTTVRRECVRCGFMMEFARCSPN